MANDWCKKKTWSEADKADFFSRLSQRGDKTKYLSIQASTLEEVGSPELLKAAITLWDQLIVEFVNDATFTHHRQLAAAYNRKAGCCLKLGDIENAIADYRRVLAIERELRGSVTNTFFDFGKLVAERKLHEHFDEALAAVEMGMNSRGMHFPSEVFYAFGIRSVIASHMGQNEKAKEFAEMALEAAAKEHSGLRYHPTAGLVDNNDTAFYKCVEAIAQN